MTRKKKKFSWVGLVSLGLVMVFLSREIWPQRELFYRRYDSSYWQRRYENSQWAKGFEATEQMGDADLYAYAGWRQVQGDDPVTINPDQPPVGKYLIGLSILLFQNPLWLSIILAGGCLILVYRLGQSITGSAQWAWLPVVLLAADRVFTENLVTSMLDLPTLFFTLVFFLALLKSLETRKSFFWPMVWLALLSGTKMYLLGFGLLGLVGGLVVYQTLTKKDDTWRRFLVSLPVFGLAYLGIWTAYFAHGHTLADFKYHHFWVRHFARVRVDDYPLGQIWRLFLWGDWLTWWPIDTGFHLVRYEKWSLIWPVSFVFLFFGMISLLRKRELKLAVFLAWPVSLLAMHTFGVPYPRYLLPILPALYLLMTRQIKIWLAKK